MLHIVKASSGLHLAVLLRIAEEHDVHADSVDTINFTFNIECLPYWLSIDFDVAEASVTPSHWDRG